MYECSVLLCMNELSFCTTLAKVVCERHVYWHCLSWTTNYFYLSYFQRISIFSLLFSIYFHFHFNSFIPDTILQCHCNQTLCTLYIQIGVGEKQRKNVGKKNRHTTQHNQPIVSIHKNIFIFFSFLHIEREEWASNTDNRLWFCIFFNWMHVAVHHHIFKFVFLIKRRNFFEILTLHAACGCA